MTDFLSYVDKELTDKKGTRYVKQHFNSYRYMLGWDIDGNIFEDGHFIIKKTGHLEPSPWTPAGTIYYLYSGNTLSYAKTIPRIKEYGGGLFGIVPDGFKNPSNTNMSTSSLKPTKSYHFMTKLNIPQTKMLYEFLLNVIELDMDRIDVIHGMNQVKLLDDCWYSEEQVVMTHMKELKTEYDLYVEELTKNNKTLLSDNTKLLEEIELLKNKTKNASSRTNNMNKSKKNTRKIPIPRGKPVSRSKVVENI